MNSGSMREVSVSLVFPFHGLSLVEDFGTISFELRERILTGHGEHEIGQVRQTEVPCEI